MPGITSIGFEPEGLCALRVIPEQRSDARAKHTGGGRPIVTLCDYYPYASGDNNETMLKNLVGHHHLEHACCTTVLEASDYKLLMTEAPQVKPDELRAALRWRVKDLIDTPIDETTIDVFNVPGEAVANRTPQVYVVAARNGAIRQRVELLTNAGANLQIIDIAEMAQRNIAALLPEDRDGVALLWFRAASGLLTVTRNGELYLSRTLSQGLDALQEPQLQESAYASVILEIQRSLDYFESRFRQAPIRHLMLAPALREIPGLVEALQDNLAAETAVIDLDQIVRCRVDMPADWQQRHFLTLGAALRAVGGTA